MISKFPEEGSVEDIFNVAMATNDTSTGSVVTTTMTATTYLDDDGDFMFIVMAAVGGTVLLIVAIMILCFCVRSRRRRQRNIRIYQERQERPLTVSLEVIDRRDHSPEVGNGVHNSLYHQSDSILPIFVYDAQGEQDMSSQQHGSAHLPDNTETATNQRERQEDESSQKSSSLQRTDILTPLASAKEKTTSQVVTIVYENTMVSNGMLSSANDKQRQLSMPNLNDSKLFSTMGIRHNSQKESKSVKFHGDYETAFPLHTNKKSENNDTIDAGIESVANNTKKHDSGVIKHEKPGDEYVKHKSTSSYTEISNSGSAKIRPKIKPKPKFRRRDEKVNSDISKGQDSHGNNSSAKMKRDMFKQAKLLDTIPPPCNKVTYVNVPGSSSPESTPGNSQEDNPITSSPKKTSNSVSNENIDNGIVDYVNMPEKKYTKSASAKVNVEADQHDDIAGNTSGKMSVEQDVSVSEKTHDNIESGKDMDSREYVNVPDKKSSHSKLEETKESESIDYINVPEKKSITSVKKETLDRKINAKINAPQIDFKNTDMNKIELEDSNSYENIPENISINVNMDDSSDYEDPGCFETLKKEHKFRDETTVKDRHDHKKKTKLKHIKHIANLKQTYDRAENTKSYELGHPRQTSNAYRGRSISESPINNEFEYENKEVANELKAAMVRQYRRGLSTSTLETGGKYDDWRTGHNKEKTKDTSKEDNITEDETYLPMDSVNTEDEDVYLSMKAQDDSPYVDMTSSVEEEVYVPMTENNSKIILSKSKTLQPEKSEDVGFAARACPTPCGGACGVYDNFSENPSHYVNCFRSKSTNNINEYSYADTKPIVKLL